MPTPASPTPYFLYNLPHKSGRRMADVDFLINLMIALGIGGLVGVEREHRRDKTQVIAGIRTFPLVAASGVLLVKIGELTASPFPLTAGTLAIGALAVALFYIRHTMGLTGLTTPFAMIVTFLAGALVEHGFRLEAVIIGVSVTTLLVSKARLHQVAGALTEDEILSALQFITIAFILFPLTTSLTGPIGPYDLVGPGRLIDPTSLLLIVVFVSSISFASFIAMRQAGPTRGVEVSGVLGGLVNSEATTASLAHLAKEHKPLEDAALVGVLLAITAMFLRNLAIAAFVDPSLSILRLMLPAVLVMTLAALAFTIRHERQGPVGNVPVQNPFAITPALKFAIAFAAIALFTFAARSMTGDAGVYGSALGAFVSAGAVVASAGSLAVGAEIPFAVAAQVAVLACIVSAGNKLLILRATNRSLLGRAALPIAVMIGFGAAALALTTWMMAG